MTSAPLHRAAVAERAVPQGRLSRADKFDDRRAELAGAALHTLSELGYARTSLREIAQNSAFSHGVLHYYFRDKEELILYCVRQYKAQCVSRYDEVVALATTAEELRHGFAAALAQTCEQDAAMHRLWYDLRNQSLFVAAFRADVVEIDASLEAMIWRVVARHAELRGSDARLSPGAAYGVLDGLFQRGLLRHLAGQADALTELREDAQQVLLDVA